MVTTAILLAAGSGKRLGGSVKKQFLDLCGKPVIYHSIETFHKSSIDEIVIVTGEEEVESVKKMYMTSDFPKVKAVVAGGKERYNSVYMGLRAVMNTDYVFIHDAARPFVDDAMLDRLLDTVKRTGACVAAVPSKDTVKIGSSDGYVTETPDRSRVWIVQTPQCFEYNCIYDAYSELIDKENAGELGDLSITDDAMVVETFGKARVKLVMGSYENIKITTPEDLPLAEQIWSSQNRFKKV